MASKPESPSEPFKRALAHAARSLAETPDLEVVFSGEGPSLSGNRAVLPHPPRDLSGKEAARIRGLADQLALMARQRRTGDAPPDGAKALVEALGPENEAKAGADRERLLSAVGDQPAFAKISRAILADLELGDDADFADEASEEEPE